MSEAALLARLRAAVGARVGMLGSGQNAPRDAGLRLFNGFLEGAPELTVDLYARTLVLHNYAESGAEEHIAPALACLLELLPWAQVAVLKNRLSGDEAARRGRLIHGQVPDRWLREHGVWYAIDLMLNQDASFYLDTRGLRAWALEYLGGRRVLNTFAYTGSLGVAAAAAGARQVLQTDLNRRFLNLAKESLARNGLPARRADFLSGDFWSVASRLNRTGELFDCVFVDPPFFSSTARGTVDLVAESHRVINKVRPLVAHNGWLVAINNALFLSGADYYQMLHELSADGYLTVETLIPVPPDCTGYPETRAGQPPVDPAPFNHTTKIAVLRVTRKDQRAA